MPPVVSIPLAIGFWFLFKSVIGGVLGAPVWVHPVFGGFVIGYIGYDLIHYATHHLVLLISSQDLASAGRVKLRRLNDRASQAMPVTYRPSLRDRNVIEPPVDAFTPQHPFNRLEPRPMPKAIFRRAALRRASGGGRGRAGRTAGLRPRRTRRAVSPASRR